MKAPFPGQVEQLNLTTKHLKALVSAACSDVFAAMSASQPMSIREIALELGKSPAAVGEHINTLLKVGLVIPAGTRKRRSRTEALYINKGRSIRFQTDSQSAAAIAAYTKRFQAQMRRIERQHAEAQKSILRDPEFVKFVQYRWANGYLSEEAAALVKQKIEDLVVLVTKLNETDLDKRAGSQHIRVTFTGLLLPSAAESRKVAKRR